MDLVDNRPSSIKSENSFIDEIPMVQFPTEFKTSDIVNVQSQNVEGKNDSNNDDHIHDNSSTHAHPSYTFGQVIYIK